MTISFHNDEMTWVSIYGQPGRTDDEEVRYHAKLDRPNGKVHIMSSYRNPSSDWRWSRDKKLATVPIELFTEFARGLKIEQARGDISGESNVAKTSGMGTQS